MFYRPYIVPLHNASIIINELFVVLLMGVLIYYNYFSFTEGQAIYCLFGFIIILFVVILIEIVRIIIVVCYLSNQ